jgi:hypothetical protein
MAEVIGNTLRLQALGDVAAPADANVGQFLRLQKSGGSYTYNYAAQTDYSIALNNGATPVTTALKSLTFSGFSLAEGAEGVVTVTAQNALGFSHNGTPYTDPVNAINFTGGGLGVNLAGGVLAVNVPTPVTQLAALTDVDLSGLVDGQTIKYDGVHSRWVPNTGIPQIVQGSYSPATYEFGPFAPPVAGMFPGRLNAPAVTLVTNATRGLVIQPGPQSGGVSHAVVYRDLTNYTAPFMATARVVPSSMSGDGHAGGVVLQRAANGAFAFLALGNSKADTEAVLRFGWVTAAGSETILNTEQNQYNWLRLGYDGNYIEAWVSGDGIIWQPFGSLLDVGTTLAGAPTRVGITNRSSAANDGSVGTLVTFWEDPDFPASARTQSGTIALGLGALSNVDLTAAPTDGQALIYSATSQTWKPATVASGGTMDYNALINKPDLRALGSQTITANAASLTIDASAGEYVILSLAANVTSFSITNWPAPAAHKVGKCTIEVHNTGNFSIDFGTAFKWVSGKPTVTSGATKIDRYVFSTGDGGTTVFGDAIGQNYA